MADSRDFYTYVSDNGSSYQVGLSSGNADAGFFGGPAAEGTNPGYPVGWRMRHVCAVSGAGKHTKIPIAHAGDSSYTSGGTISKDGVTYTIQGRIGERMTSKK